MDANFLKQQDGQLVNPDLRNSPDTQVETDILAGADIQIEDDRTGMRIDTLKRAFADNLFYLQGTDEATATLYDYYKALAYTVRDRILQRFIKTRQTWQKEQVKVVCYMSAEFLTGRHLSNNLINLGIYDRVQEVVENSGLNLEELIEQEPDPGLGNGGLGRLAACFLDSLATLSIPAIGYGIRYEFGIFHQIIKNGWQGEIPDNWLRFGNPWEVARPDETVEIKLGGHTEAYHDEQDNYRVRWVPDRTVLAIPYDTPIPGYKTNTVNPLRLWKAEASEAFNFDAFNAGNYDRAVADKISSETISKVLYPNDNTPQGRELRLAQQYFFVSASLQDLIRIHLNTYDSLDNFYERATIQLNDTHPVIAIPELMRLLVDEHHLGWEQAWEIVQKTFAFTNHTLLPEALERWSVDLLSRLLPRHLEIIYEINFRFLEDVVRIRFPDDDERLARLSIIEESHNKMIRMANLACVGSHSINGVAALHTELLQKLTLRDFAALWPHKFYNKTNGVTPRRWMLLSNPKLSELITEKVGDDSWIKNLDQLEKLKAFAEDAEFRTRWRQIKLDNKRQLADYILKTTGIKVDVNSIFDIQVKRIHEYKRQHLAVLHIISLYNRIKEHPNLDIQPRTFIFGGKAAPGYFMAKLVIKLINAVADIVNKDPDVRDRLKVVFLENFNVSLGEKIYPAADLSEQISTAGKEASGTGNMKFAMNGAMTIGTLDGANIEIREQVGAENFFLFGLTAEEVRDLKAKGYYPRQHYNSNPDLKKVIDRIAHGFFSQGDRQLFKPICDHLLNQDQYMLLADYQAYIDCQEQVSQAYRDQEKWTRMSIINSASMGKFSADRTIKEYCNEIWKVKPVDIQLEGYQQEAVGLNVRS